MDLVKEIRNEGVSQPIILFTYYNPIFSMGLDLFFQRAQRMWRKWCFGRRSASRRSLRI